MKQVLFLDPERALTSERYRHRFGAPDLPLEHGELLVQLLKPYPQIFLFLYGPAVEHFGLEAVRDWLPLPLDARVIEPVSRSLCRNSAEAIKALAWQEEVFRFLVLEEDDSGWPLFLRKRVVVINPRFGIGASSVQEDLAAKLARLPGAPGYVELEPSGDKQ